jgi:hypothetical protein
MPRPPIAARFAVDGSSSPGTQCNLCLFCSRTGWLLTGGWRRGRHREGATSGGGKGRREREGEGSDGAARAPELHTLRPLMLRL